VPFSFFLINTKFFFNRASGTIGISAGFLVMEFFKKVWGSVEIIVFYNVLGGFAPATAAAPVMIFVENRFIMDIW